MKTKREHELILAAQGEVNRIALELARATEKRLTLELAIATEALRRLMDVDKPKPRVTRKPVAKAKKAPTAVRTSPKRKTKKAAKTAKPRAAVKRTRRATKARNEPTAYVEAAPHRTTTVGCATNAPYRVGNPSNAFSRGITCGTGRSSTRRNDP